MLYLYADFNTRTGKHTRFEGGRLPLFWYGSIRDISDKKVELHEGMHIIVYDSEVQAEALIEKFEDNWWAWIVGTIHQIPEEEALKRRSLFWFEDTKDDHGADQNS